MLPLRSAIAFQEGGGGDDRNGEVGLVIENEAIAAGEKRATPQAHQVGVLLRGEHQGSDPPLDPGTGTNRQGKDIGRVATAISQVSGARAARCDQSQQRDEQQSEHQPCHGMAAST